MLYKVIMNSNYKDPYLHAIRKLAGVGDRAEDSKFTGYEHLERWMVLPRSGAALRCVPAGIALRPPTGEAHASAYARACSTAGVTDDLLPIRQLDDVDT